MQAVTVQFDYGDTRYERLLEKFASSWKRNARIPLRILRIKPPELGSRKKGFYSNHRKLRAWIDAVDGDTIFVDCDMLLLECISDGFQQVEHIGFTERPGPFPINGGVVFVRDTNESRQFLEKWYEVDRRMLTDVEFHMQYHEKYAGINQSSMGYMLESDYGHLVSLLPCSTYNLCDGQWDEWTKTKLIHIKGRLRELILEGKWRYPQGPDREALKQIADLWESY